METQKLISKYNDFKENIKHQDESDNETSLMHKHRRFYKNEG